METLTVVKGVADTARPISPASDAHFGPGASNRTETMEAAVITAPGEFHLVHVPLPEPSETEVRVRLEGCGVCGSNLASWEGRPWFNYPLEPGGLGHEGWGVIDKVGTKVFCLSPGERVALLSYHAYAEYDVAPQNCVVPLPPALAGRPFPGEALGCAMNVFRRSDVFPGQTVAVVGIGFLGAILTALCSRAGARVIAISRRPFALDVARKMGSNETIPLDDPQRVIPRIKELTLERLCDCVIEAVGQQGPLDLAAELVRERGRLIIAGYHQDGPRQVNMQLWNWRGLDVINAHERDPRIYVSGMEAAAKDVAEEIFDPTPLYTHTFRLNQLGDAFETMRKRPEGFMKALITYENSAG